MNKNDATEQAFQNGYSAGYCAGRRSVGEVSDEKLQQAIRMLIKQYEHSRQSDYVHNPVAHALYHTWKQVDENGTE